MTNAKGREVLPRPPVPHEGDPAGRPSTPTTGPLAFVELVAAIATVAGVMSALWLLTPLGHQPVANILTRLAHRAWKPAWLIALIAWAVGIVPRHITKRTTHLDMLAIAALRAAGRLCLVLLKAVGRLALRGIQAAGRRILRIPAVERTVGNLATPWGKLLEELRKQPPPIAPEQPSIKPEPKSLIVGGPPLQLLPSDSDSEHAQDRYAQQVLHALAELGIAGATSAEEILGPTVTRVHVQLPAGVRATPVMNLRDDLAVGLGVAAVFIRAVKGAPNTLAIEIPLAERRPVFLRAMLSGKAFRSHVQDYTLPVALGIDTSADPVIYDLVRAPHLLVAGSTGNGKSVFLNDLLISLLYARTPQQLQWVLVDPKRVEFGTYKGLPHLVMPPITEVNQVPGLLDWLITEMEARYTEMERIGVKKISQYNAKAGSLGVEPFSYLLFVVDELADLMVQAKGKGKGKRKSKQGDDGEEEQQLSVEERIQRLAQMARAAGIHLVLATQRPSVDVITGIIKANIDARVAFRVSDVVNSRVILDGAGAETLAGLGDMLFRAPGADMVRAQAPLVDEDAVGAVVQWWIANWKGPRGRLLTVPPGGGRKSGQSPVDAAAAHGDPPPPKIEFL